MDNCQLILNSNCLCVFCLSEVKVKVCKDDLFPLHHLTSKINSNLGNVFKDVTVPWAPLPVFGRMEILADACKDCVDLCEELLYKFQDDAGRENCVEALVDKMEKAVLKDAYKNCGSPVAVFYLGIVDRLRKEIMQKLNAKSELGEKPNLSVGPQRIPNLLNIPDLPMSHICSYLSFKDIRNCSTVSKNLRRLVFPSLINSSFISFQNQSQIPAMIDFIKAISNNLKKGVNLSVNSRSINESSANRSALLILFRECGSHIHHLKLTCTSGTSILEEKVVNCFRNNNSIPVRIGNELFPSMGKLDLVFYDPDVCDPDVYAYTFYEEEELDREKKYRHNQIKASFPFMKAVFGNSPILKELKLYCGYTEVTYLLFKLIGESGLHLDTFQVKKAMITDESLAYLQPLNLTKVSLEGSFNCKISRSFTNFLESQRNTLKHLELKVREETLNQFIPHFEFPRMELLETYKLNANDMINKEKLGPISYPTQLPNLKELELKHINEDYFSTLFPLHAKSTTSVKELRLLVPTVEKDIILRSTRTFECLSKLEIPVASYLRQLWKDLSGLEELTLHPSDTGKSRNEVMWIDEIFAGFTIYELSSFDSSATDRAKDIRRYEELGYGRKHHRVTKESLAMLTRLRLLRLRSGVIYSYGPRLMLSDIACTFVLMKMENLKCIDFCGIHATSVGASKKVLDEMGKKMNLCFGEKDERKY